MDGKHLERLQQYISREISTRKSEFIGWKVHDKFLTYLVFMQIFIFGCENLYLY